MSIDGNKLSWYLYWLYVKLNILFAYVGMLIRILYRKQGIRICGQSINLFVLASAVLHHQSHTLILF